MVCVSVPVAADAAIDAAGADAAATAGTAAAADAAGAAGTTAAGDLAASAIPAGVEAGAPVYGSEAAAAGANSAMGLSGAAANPLSALMSSLTSGVSSGYDSAANGISSLVGGADPGAAGVSSGVGQGFDAAGDSVAANSPDATSFGTSGPGVVSGSGTGVPASSKGLLGLNTSNPFNDVMAGSVGLGAISSLLPKKQVNVGQNAQNVMNTNPSFSNPNLPQYSMQNTATPYTGNWYTYGQNPQTPLYNAQPVPVAKTGGLIKAYAKGGTVHSMPSPLSGAMGGVPMVSNQPVRRFAMGGAVPPPGPMAPQMPMGAPPAMQMPQQAPQPPQAQRPVNPLALKAVHNIGVAIGKHIRSKMPKTGPVNGPGGGHDDLIPAKLSDGEFVHSADVVAALGDGSTKEGGKKLKAFDAAVRAHKTKNGSKFPPKAKNPLSYLPKGSI